MRIWQKSFAQQFWTDSVSKAFPGALQCDLDVLNTTSLNFARPESSRQSHTAATSTARRSLRDSERRSHRDGDRPQLIINTSVVAPQRTSFDCDPKSWWPQNDHVGLVHKENRRQAPPKPDKHDNKFTTPSMSRPMQDIAENDTNNLSSSFGSPMPSMSTNDATDQQKTKSQNISDRGARQRPIITAEPRLVNISPHTNFLEDQPLATSPPSYSATMAECDEQRVESMESSLTLALASPSSVFSPSVPPSLSPCSSTSSLSSSYDMPTPATSVQPRVHFSVPKSQRDRSPKRNRSPQRDRSPKRNRSPQHGRSPKRNRSPRRGHSPQRDSVASGHCLPERQSGFESKNNVPRSEKDHSSTYDRAKSMSTAVVTGFEGGRGFGNYLHPDYARSMPNKGTALDDEDPFKSFGDHDHEQEQGKFMGRPKAKSISVQIPSAMQRDQCRAYSMPTRVTSRSYTDMPWTPAVSFLANLADSTTSLPLPDEEGTQIGEFVLGPVIARGGFSTVREAFGMKDDTSSMAKYAVKIIFHDKDPIEDERRQALVQKEIQIWRALQHENIVTFLDAEENEHATYIFSEYCPGGTLLQHVKECGCGDRGLDEDEARIIFTRISDAVRYLHNDMRLVHKDIKLDNILLDIDGAWKLCDFGLAEFQNPENDYTNLSCEDEAGGTLAYCPPEQLRSKSRIRHPSIDIWSLGVVLFAMVTGTLPFNDDFGPRLQHKILNGRFDQARLNAINASDDLVDLLRGMFRTKPEQRITINQVLLHPWCEP